MKQASLGKMVIRAGFGLLLLWAVVSCERGIPSEVLVLNDFESSSDLERIAWRCRTTFALTKEYRSHGQSSLWMTLYPDDYPGLQILLATEERHWKRYRYLALEVANPERVTIALAYRIDDKPSPDYGDRINGSFLLEPGMNHLRLDLSQMQTSGTSRRVDLDHIDKLLFFLVAPPQPVSLAVDYVRLEPDILPR